MEIQFKVGNAATPTNLDFEKLARDGQLIDIRHDGFFAEAVRKHSVVIRFPLDLESHLGHKIK